VIALGLTELTVVIHTLITELVWILNNKKITACASQHLKGFLSLNALFFVSTIY